MAVQRYKMEALTSVKKQKMSGNYLDKVPVYHENCRFEISEQKEVTILIEHKGVFHRITQKLLGKPKVSQIHLDRMGNYIWPLIDGQKSIYEIAESVRQEFGEKAEPLYPRIVQYFQTLNSYSFIRLKEPAAEQEENKE